MAPLIADRVRRRSNVQMATTATGRTIFFEKKYLDGGGGSRRRSPSERKKQMTQTQRKKTPIANDDDLLCFLPDENTNPNEMHGSIFFPQKVSKSFSNQHRN